MNIKFNFYIKIDFITIIIFCLIIIYIYLNYLIYEMKLLIYSYISYKKLKLII